MVIVGEGTLDGGPEGGRVARLPDVGEFVDDDVVDQGDGQLHGGPVDVEAVVLAEGAPAVAEVADVQVAWVQPHPLGPGSDAPRPPGPGAVLVPPDYRRSAAPCARRGPP